MIEVILFICLAGFFDYMMDMRKDFADSKKNWLYIWCLKHYEYLPWYMGNRSLPFMEKRGYTYNPQYPWTSDAWHTAKHFMILSFTGIAGIATAVIAARYFDLEWYYEFGIQIFSWWFYYWLQGKIFNLGYQRLK